MEADKDEAWKELLRQNSTGGRIQLPNGGFCWTEGSRPIPEATLQKLQNQLLARRRQQEAEGEKEAPLTAEEIANIEAAGNTQCFVTGQRGMFSLIGIPLCCHPRDLQEEDSKEASERNARIRANLSDKNERDKLCKALRIIHHNATSSADIKLIVTDPTLALSFLLQVIFEIQDAISSESIREHCRQQFEENATFWDFDNLEFKNAEDIEAQVEPFLTFLESWINELDKDEQDFMFPVYPVGRQGRKLRAPSEAALDRVPYITPLLGTFLSVDAYFMGLDGCKEFELKSNQERGFGGLFYRDTSDDFRVLQFRDQKGKLHFITDIFPLCTHPDPDKHNEFVIEFKHALSRIMKCRDDRFTPDLIMEIVPRILTATVSSLIKEGNAIDFENLDSILDAFTLVDYSAVKAIHAVNKECEGNLFSSLYSKIMKFVFYRSAYGNKIGALPELLCKMSLCGVPWPQLREPFMREFIVRAVKRYAMREGASALEYKNHLENQCERDIRLCLFLLCFNGVHMSMKKKVELYDRNRGILPKNLKRNVTAMIKQVAKVKTFEDIFLMMGLAPLGMDNHEVRKLVLKVIGWAIANKEKAYTEANNEIPIIIPSSFEEYSATPCSIHDVDIRDFETERERAVKKRHDAVAEQHGDPYPPLQSDGSLPDKTCAECGRVYNSRRELFRRHLYQVWPDLQQSSNKYYGYHSSHRKLQPPYGTCVDGKWICGVSKCAAVFEGENEEAALRKFHWHLKHLGAIGDWTHVPEEDGEKEKEGAKESSEDDVKPLEECVSCMDEHVATMLQPCGHQILCVECAEMIVGRIGSCPVCREKIASFDRLYGL